MESPSTGHSDAECVSPLGVLTRDREAGASAGHCVPAPERRDEGGVYAEGGDEVASTFAFFATFCEIPFVLSRPPQPWRRRIVSFCKKNQALPCFRSFRALTM